MILFSLKNILEVHPKNFEFKRLTLYNRIINDNILLYKVSKENEGYEHYCMYLKDKKVNKYAEDLLVEFFKNKDNRLVLDAKGLNAILRTGALAFEAAYLGFGLPALNQIRLEKKYLSKDGKKPQTTATASNVNTIINSRAVSENRIKTFNKFIKYIQR